MPDKKRDMNLYAGAIIALIFVAFSFSGLAPFERLERNIYDRTTALSDPGDQRATPVTLIDIDDKSLNELGSWPWPRRVIAEMISLLDRKGAGPIGLDIPFMERENNPGLVEVKTFREKYDTRSRAEGVTTFGKWVLDNLDQIEKRLDHDRGLIESVGSHPVVLPLTVRSGSQKAADNRDGTLLSKHSLDSSSISSSLKERSSVAQLASPFHELALSAEGLGHTHLLTHHPVEGRSHPVFIHYKGYLLPSFPVRLAMVYLNLQPKQVPVKDDRMVLKGRSIPLEQGLMLIRIHDDRMPFPRFSFTDLLKSEKLQAGLKGKIVLIGTTHSQSRQPDIPGMPGMGESGLIAQILQEILQDGYMARPFFMPYVEIFLILLAGIASALFFPRWGQAVRLFTTLGAVVLILIVCVGLSMMGFWFNPVYAACCLIAVYLYVLFKSLFLSETLGGDSRETNRLLGLSYQSQGLLDLAFEKFQKLQMNNETKDLIYNLGLEYEKKQLTEKALTAYEYIHKGGGFRDLDDRIPQLKALDKSSTLGSYDMNSEPGILSESEPTAHSQVGRYEIIGQLGRGSMGLVYKAQDPKIHRLVAIKTIRFSDEFDEDVIQEIKARFFREAEIAGQLSHPSIVIIHDVGDDGELTYMAMEYLEGEDLDKFTKKGKLLSFRRVLDIVARIAEALDFAHKTDVIHRDIKPANVMLLKNGTVKVTDFGIAKAISSSRTKTGVILGTPNYMSPEQIMGQKIDSKSDIFSLGVLFYQLITGELPFHGENLSGLLYQITQVKHPSPRQYNPKIPRVCEQILDKALDKDPAKRFRSAGDMAKVIHLLGEKIDQLRKKKAAE